MRFSDRSTGSALALLGAVTMVGGWKLPPMHGQPVGPSAFPMTIGAAMCVCGVLVAIGIGKSFEAEEPEEEGAVGSPGHRLRELRVLIPVGLLVLYAAAIDTVGFIPLTAFIVAVMSRTLGARWSHTAILAVAAPVLVHLIFAKLLRVPLASGWLPMPW